MAFVVVPSTHSFLKVFFAPPDTPQDRVEFLRRSFDKVVALNGFLRHAKSRFGALAPPAKGEEVEKVAKDLVNIPKADIDAFLKVLDMYLTR